MASQVPNVGMPECELPHATNSRSGSTIRMARCRLRRHSSVFVRGLVPYLPGAIQLVAQAPDLDVEWLPMTVRNAQVRPIRATRVIAVLEEIDCLLHPSGSQVESLHHLDIGLAGPVGELGDSEGVGLQRVPRGVETGGTLLHGSGPILPAIPGHEVATRVANHADSHLPNQIEHVAVEPVPIGCLVIRLENPGVNTAAHMLNERSEGPPLDLADSEIGIDGQRGLKLRAHEGAVESRITRSALTATFKGTSVSPPQLSVGSHAPGANDRCMEIA